MKINELLKHLENVETDEDNTEKREIAEYLAQTFSADDLIYIYYIMTKDKKIYEFDSYGKLLDSNKVSPNDAYVYVEYINYGGYYPVRYYFCPFLIDKYLFPNVYLSKLGFRYYVYLSKLGFRYYGIVPATGLKYVSMVIHLNDLGRIVVEIADVDTVIINTNLPTLTRGILGTKQISDREVGDIASKLDSQKLFAGYDSYEAEKIINRYYEDHDTSLAKDVEAIKDAYNRIFQPFRIIYDLKTKQFIPT